MKIVVLGGGISLERQISLKTSAVVLDTLRQQGHKAIFVDLFLGVENDSDSLFESEDGMLEQLKNSVSMPLAELNAIYSARCGASIGPHVFELCQKADFVFLGLHGADGEDGKIQGMLDLLSVPYNGPGPLGSAMAMDKSITRQIMQINGVDVPPIVSDAPCVIKLVHGGSSIGLHVCESEEELETALSEMQEYGDDFIIERKIEGTEVSVGVLDNFALPPIELVPPEGHVLDNEAKFAEDGRAMSVICPARISDQKTQELQRIALKMHQALKLSGYSRMDFILDSSGRVWGLEVNTLTGFTRQSVFPVAAAQIGIDFAELCSRIIDLGISRSASLKKKLVKEMTQLEALHMD